MSIKKLTTALTLLTAFSMPALANSSAEGESSFDRSVQLSKKVRSTSDRLPVDTLLAKHLKRSAQNEDSTLLNVKDQPATTLWLSEQASLR